MGKKWILLVFVLVLALCFSNVSADNFQINGTVYDFNGNALNNTYVNVTVKLGFETDLGTNSTTTNATGWFNLTIPSNQNYMYQLTIIHTNSTTGAVDYVGQTLPTFPYAEFSRLSSVNYYLKEAGTINITVINSSQVAVPYNQFGYQVKDTKLGYPTGSCSSVGSYSYICYVPRDRNYSIMIYPSQGSPQHFVPVSYDWNNFTATQDYNIGSLSSYNATTKTLKKQFNVTESYARISGYLNGTGVGVNSWSEFTVVPFLSESGNMIFMTYGTMPFNASVISNGLYATDDYNLTTGFYNITLPYAASETVRYILFAAAKNGTTYYGSYRNITVTGNVALNFTMYGMLGSNSVINQSSFNGGFHAVNISRQTFQLINGTRGSSNESLSNVNAHIEATVDYSNYGAIEFTFMEDISGQNNGNFSLPLINATGVKEINVFLMQQAPKRVPTKSPAQIQANNNISVSSFRPEALDGTAGASISISIYKSNSTCDVPNPDSLSGCLLTSSNMGSFNPFSYVIGGGKISFRMGMSGVLVHYVDVDMLASGPPDAMFDNNNAVTESTTGGFSKAMRFGSNGPTIYSHVLISIPYTQGISGSQSGLNESATVNMSIPAFYGENWTTPVWNTSVNGINATLLAGNDSHYNTYKSEWQTLMGNNTCVNTTGLSEINSSYPCHIDIANNKIWMRLPHFSGTGPDIDGDGITVTTTTTTIGGGGGGGGGGGATTNKTHKKTQTWTKITPGSATIMKIVDPEIGFKQINITVRNPAQTVTITVTKLDGKPASVTHEISGKVYKYIEIKGDNINETHIDKVKIQFEVNKSWINANSIDPNTIALNRYNNGWEKLSTIKINEDNDFVYYEAETPGFSTFAISGEVMTVVTTTVATATTIPSAITTTLPVTTIPTPIVDKGTYLLIIFVIIIIVAIIGFWLYKSRLVLKSKTRR
jgi:PGF-pre-PGF domain-containing protein